MHLHDGGLNPTSHIHVPAIIIQSHVASVILSDCDGHATAVSSQEPSVTGKNDWVSGSMSDGSGTQVTSCRPPPGLVGSQCLNESQMQWSAADTGAEACHARSPTQVDDVCPQDSISSPSSRRQATFESGSLPEICAPVPTPKLASCLKVSVSKSFVELAREVARLQGEPAGKEEDSETSDESGRLLVPESARVVCGRLHSGLRLLVDHLMCRDGFSEESLL